MCHRRTPPSLMMIAAACCVATSILSVATPCAAITVSLAADCTCPLEHDFGVWHPAWSPDGQSLALASGNAYPPLYLYWGSVYAVPVGGGSSTCAFGDHTFVAYPSWAPDSRRIAFVESGIALYVLDCDSIDPPIALLQSNDPVHPAWSPDGSTIAFANENIWLIPASGGAATQLTTGGGDSPAWSPDGSRIAFHTGGAIWTIGASGGEPQRLGEGRDPAWSPDGKWIAFASDRAGDSDIWVIATTGGTAVRVTDSPQNESDPTWAPDQRSLAFTAATQGNECSCVFIASDLPVDWTTPVTSWTWGAVKTLYR